MNKQELFQKLKAYLLDKKITKAAVFGSFARNEETENSDLDLLIEAKGLTMFDILRIEDELESLYKRKIDLVEYSALKPSIEKHVYRDFIQLI
jgi:uncharacterized protein